MSSFAQRFPFFFASTSIGLRFAVGDYVVQAAQMWDSKSTRVARLPANQAVETQKGTTDSTSQIQSVGTAKVTWDHKRAAVFGAFGCLYTCGAGYWIYNKLYPIMFSAGTKGAVSMTVFDLVRFVLSYIV